MLKTDESIECNSLLRKRQMTTKIIFLHTNSFYLCFVAPKSTYVSFVNKIAFNEAIELGNKSFKLKLENYRVNRFSVEWWQSMFKVNYQFSHV